MACQSAGRPGFGGSGRSGIARAASEYRFGSEVEGLPVTEIDSAHLDATPETAEAQPGLVRLIEHNIRVDGIEVVCLR